LPIILSSCTAFKASDTLSWGSVPNDRGVLALKDAGFKAIVNFRTNSHKGRAKFVRAQGMKFFNVHTGVFKTPEEAELKEYLDIICDPANQPVYVSCNIGIDRTSYYVAAYRIAVQGWTIQQASDEMLAHGLKQWWPTFVQFKDSLTANEAYMRRIAREHGCAPQFSRPAVTPCACVELFNNKTSLLSHKHLSPVDNNATTTFDAAHGSTTGAVGSAGGAAGAAAATY